MMRDFFLMLRRPALAVLTCALSWAVLAQSSPAAPLTPAQAAYLRAESQRAQDRFVNRVAEISGAKRSTVRRALPAPGRITDPVSRLVSALELSLEHPLSEDQKLQIAEAENAYQRERLLAEANARMR